MFLLYTFVLFTVIIKAKMMMMMKMCQYSDDREFILWDAELGYPWSRRTILLVISKML